MRLFVVLATVALIGTSAFGQGRTQSVEELLNRRLPEVTFQDTPFETVMDYLAEQIGINVRVNWQTLENFGVSRDTPISVRVKNLRISQILWIIMNDASTDVKLAYRASSDLLVMSTAEELGKEMIVKVYSVSDLLARVPRFTNAPEIDISQAQGVGQGGGGGQNIFGGNTGGQTDDDDDEDDEQDEELQELIELITTTVEPDTWEINAGPGTIRAFRGQLVVRNNILVHQALGGAIEEATE